MRNVYSRGCGTCRRSTSHRRPQSASVVLFLWVSESIERDVRQGPEGHIKPIPDGEDFAVGAAPAIAARSGVDQEALDRALAVRLQQVCAHG